MGEGILNGLTTYLVDTKETITAEVIDEPIEDDASNAAGQDTPPVSQQMVNNNPTFSTSTSLAVTTVSISTLTS